MVLRVLVVRCGTVGGDASGNGARRSLTLEQHRGAAQPPGKVLSTAAHQSDRVTGGGGSSPAAHIGGCSCSAPPALSRCWRRRVCRAAGPYPPRPEEPPPPLHPPISGNPGLPAPGTSGDLLPDILRHVGCLPDVLRHVGYLGSASLAGASALVAAAGSAKFRRSTEQGVIWSFLQKK
jgi:hypothetical protein